MPKPLLPLFLDLDGRPALVLGDGEAADRRATTLRACGADVRHIPSGFEPAMLDGCVIAVGAEAPEPDLLAMTTEARRRGIPFNVVDRPSLSGYSTPAVVSRAPLQIAIASGGAAPVLARLLRARIESLVPPGFGKLAALADRMQAETRRILPDVLRRRRMLEAAFSGPVAELMLAGREADAEAAYRDALGAAAEAGKHPEQGIAYLVDPGPGDADLVTLRALRLLGEADIILYEASESAAVLELARRDASRLEITAGDAVVRIVELASQGAKLVRLSPHPGEAALVRAAGHVCVEVPGVRRTAD
ncbi:SAM-dependent methyltransferase [Lichenicola sp.]|uniref:SAM-dependent methyltransferase n=1 Tax=Lichenicola sp. TaxID=2804529 RepID=UPI003B0043C7